MAFDSPPAVINDTLVVGSALDDMTEARPPGSAVRGLDARTGAPGWRFDPEPRSPTGASAVRRRQCLGADRGGPGNGSRVPADRLADCHVLWRRAARRRQIRIVGRGAGRDHRHARMELPGDASRHLGLRCRGAAKPCHLAPERPRRACRRRRDEDGLRLRARPRHRAAAVPGGGAGGPGERRAGRGGGADAAGALSTAAAGAAAPR